MQGFGKWCLKIGAFLGVADFGYDFYLLAIASLSVGIAKLLHGQYFRLLDFYFHTLIQQRPFLFVGFGKLPCLPTGKRISKQLKLFPVPCSLSPVPYPHRQLIQQALVSCQWSVDNDH